MKHIYLSPHFDDVVYSCGGLIDKQIKNDHNVLVVTIFGGHPPSHCLSPLAQSFHSEWNININQDVVKQRAKEDEGALSLLGATQEYAPFLDAIYRKTDNGKFAYLTNRQLFNNPHPTDEAVLNEVEIWLLDLLSPDKSGVTIYAPLGIGNHADHVLLYKAALRLFDQGFNVLFYEDQPYASKDYVYLIESIFPRISNWWRPIVASIEIDAKLDAMACYLSQKYREQAKKKVSEYAIKIGGNRYPVERLWQPIKRTAVSLSEWQGIILCPKCYGKLQPGQKNWKCKRCKKDYPVRFGILDLRLFDSGHEGNWVCEDLDKAGKLWSIYDDSSYHDLVNFCVQDTDSLDLENRYQAYRLNISKRVKNILTRQIGFSPMVYSRSITGPGLDIGCGSGIGILALMATAPSSIGVDIKISELICARKLLEEKGFSETTILIAAFAENLPLRDDYFSTIIARDVYEHVTNRGLFLENAYSALKPNGIFLCNTTSRFSWVEPHVQMIGIGYLPRFLQPMMVRLFRDRNYDIFLPSMREFKEGICNNMPTEAACVVMTSKYIKTDRPAKTLKGKLIRKIPWLVHLINSLYARTHWFEAVISKPLPDTRYNQPEHDKNQK